MPTTEERFWQKVRKTEDCWEWTASKRNKGYGAFCYREDGRLIQGRAHRYSYEIHIGAVPEGMCVLHRCDNPACVRPDHLFLGTKADNNADMVAKGRHVPGGTYCGTYSLCGEMGEWKRGERHHNAKLTDEQTRLIREDYEAGGLSFSKLAAKWGISISHAFRIVRRKQWKHVL